MTDSSRRDFLRTTAAGSAVLVLPTYIPRTWLFGGTGTPPSRTITVAQIGCGRMGMEDLRGTMAHDLCRIVAVCDLDANRRAAAQAEVTRFYRARGERAVDVRPTPTSTRFWRGATSTR